MVSINALPYHKLIKLTATVNSKFIKPLFIEHIIIFLQGLPNLLELIDLLIELWQMIKFITYKVEQLVNTGSQRFRSITVINNSSY